MMGQRYVIKNLKLSGLGARNMIDCCRKVSNVTDDDSKAYRGGTFNPEKRKQRSLTTKHTIMKIRKS